MAATRSSGCSGRAPIPLQWKRIPGRSRSSDTNNRAATKSARAWLMRNSVWVNTARLPRASSRTSARADPSAVAPARYSPAKPAAASKNSITMQPASFLDDLFRIGQEGLLQRRAVGDRRVRRRHPHDGPVQVFEDAFRNGGGQFARHAAAARVLVQQQRLRRLAYARADGLAIQRH